jgi:hypothetical protein
MVPFYFALSLFTFVSYVFYFFRIRDDVTTIQSQKINNFKNKEILNRLYYKNPWFIWIDAIPLMFAVRYILNDFYKLIVFLIEKDRE